MNSADIRKDIFMNYAKACSGFLVLMVASILIFFSCVQEAVERNAKDTIISHVERQSYHFETIINEQYGYLEAVADCLGSQENLISDNNMRLIRAFQEKSGLERLAIIDKKGLATYDNGVQKDVGTREYFLEAMEGNHTLSDPLESRLDGATRVILGVPIYDSDREIVGVLGGSYDVGTLSQMLFEDIYDGAGYSFVLSAQGDIVSIKDSSDDENLAPEDNFFSYYKNAKFLDQVDMEDIQTDFMNQKDGFVQLRDGKQDYFLTYVPLRLRDWMLCYVVSADKAREAYSFINEYETVLSGVLAVGVLIFFLFIIRINFRKQKDILRYAELDGLTGVLNRRSLEEKIDTWLRNEECRGVQAFLMLDVDKFKEINDVFGHAAGDEVLRKMGHVLKKQFRDSDILGRIGGDEFVVFMKNVGSPEEACRRAESLAEYIRKIEIPNVVDGSLCITTSIGLAFAPEHGDHYMDLYQCADQALYETKRNGRDGVSVYEDTKKDLSGNP